MTENLSPETLAGASHMSAADGGGTVESPALTLAELNAKLGSNFKDTATALQSMKETKDFVGRRKEDIAAEVKASLIPVAPSDVASKTDVQDLKNQLFLSENPQLKDHVDVLRAINTDLAEASKSPGLQPLLEKAQKADEIASNKSVVASNARLSQVQSTVDKAVTIANARGTTHEDVALVFAQQINSQNNER